MKLRHTSTLCSTAALLLLLVPPTASAVEEITTLKIGETVSVPEGKIAEFKSAFISLPNGSVLVTVGIFGTIQGETIVLPLTSLGSVVPTQLLFLSKGASSSGIPNVPLTIEGPVEFQYKFVGATGAGAMVNTVMIIRDKVVGHPSTTPGTTVAKCAVVIPSDSTGDVEIKLESSTDMVNWSSSLPGLYGATTKNRFFRVRAENQ